MVILIGDYTSREAMRYHRKTFEMLNFSITEIYFEDFTEDEIKVWNQVENFPKNILENFGKAIAYFLQYQHHFAAFTVKSGRWLDTDGW